ncbi:MAG: hypothetical protein RMA76_28125 [Deltaproteobacteria bacterium]
MQNLIFFGVLVAVGLAILAGFAMMVAKFYKKVEQGRALIINKVTKEPIVTFTGGLVLPIVHRAETMDISVKTVEIDRRGKEGLICKDNIRADIKVTFFVKVNKTAEDVLKVAQQVGCTRASSQETLEELFLAKFSEALKTVGKQLDFVELYTKREDFKDEIIRTIGRDLNGYVLDDAAIDFLEQTPLESLDRENILDAQGIRKITELTTAQNVHTNELRQAERKAIKKQDVEAEEAVLALERQEQDARAKQAREIATMKAREEAETRKVEAEEYKKASVARLKAEEEVKVSEEAKNRQIEVAKKNRERVVAVETERVEKDRALEQISRERETELSRIAKEKELEVEKKEIADVIRGRIAVEKTVAEEEERIKDTRAIAEAKRSKEVQVTAASAEAEENMVKQVKAAEAGQEVAKFKAKERLTLADAELEAADRSAQAKIRIAEGVQAEVAAEGLAKVRVREADAVALEKEGSAKARITQSQMEAEARGKEAQAAAIEKQGLAEAAVTREGLLATAKGEEEKGLAAARVHEADAAAREKMGLAEAVAIEKKLTAEATGLRDKAEAMKALDGVGREHEEFRLRLEKDKEVELASVTARVNIAEARAQIMKAAFAAANINIVGGDGGFFDKFVDAVSMGKSVDGFVENSSNIQQLFGKYLNGNGNLPADVLQALSGFSTKDLQNVSVAGLLGKLMLGADDATKHKLQSLLKHAEELGVDDALPPPSSDAN